MEQEKLIQINKKEFNYKELQKSGTSFSDYLCNFGITIAHNTTWRQGRLFVTNCSAKKYEVDKAKPKELYDSVQVRNLVSFCERNEYPYGILSAKHGLVMSYEIIENYNSEVYGKGLPDELVLDLAQKLNSKLMINGFSELLFCAPSPIFAFPYFRIMLKAKELNSRLRLIYATKLCITNQSNLDSFMG